MSETQQLPSFEPSTIQAGDTVTFQLALYQYPATDGWVAFYYLIGQGKKYSVQAATAADGASFLFTIPSAATEGWPAGDYRWQTKVSASGAVYTVHGGAVKVLADISTAAATYDPRSYAQQMVEQVENTIQALASSTAQSKTIAGVTYTQKDLGKLHILRQQFLEEAANEKNKADIQKGLGGGRTVFVEFRKSSL